MRGNSKIFKIPGSGMLPKITPHTDEALFQPHVYNRNMQNRLIFEYAADPPYWLSIGWFHSHQHSCSGSFNLVLTTVMGLLDILRFFNHEYEKFPTIFLRKLKSPEERDTTILLLGLDNAGKTTIL